jgi:peroxiredoxin Q/BCP
MRRAKLFPDKSFIMWCARRFEAGGKEIGAMPMLATTVQEGQSAPAFTLPDADMETVDIGDLLGRTTIVLYFYPKDGSPNCTLEAVDFSDHEADFDKYDAVVMGVSQDDCLRHAEFRDEHGISIRLLADVEGDVSRQYGVLAERESNGVVRTCIQRSTFVIDKEGVVRHALFGVNPRGHAREVLELVKQL